jgi:hypothetical protein
MASRELATQDDPIHVDHKTIYRWATDRHADEYERVLAEEWPKIKAITAERHR